MKYETWNFVSCCTCTVVYLQSHSALLTWEVTLVILVDTHAPSRHHLFSPQSVPGSITLFLATEHSLLEEVGL